MVTKGIALDHTAVRQLLPHRPSLLLVDKVEAYDPRAQRLVAVKNLSHNDPFLGGHFPEYPIFPGVLIVEALLQACTILMHLAAQFGEAVSEDDFATRLRSFTPPRSVLAESRVKHVAPCYPGDQIRLEAQLAGTTGAISTCKVRALTQSGEVCATGRISVALSAEHLSAARDSNA
jgi:3-hydroxyacyl-[acyl-carrier-protein] dehydratase